VEKLSWAVSWNPIADFHELTIFAETFWVDIQMRNPLDATVNLTALTVSVDSSVADGLSFVDAQIIDEITLGAYETRTVRMLRHCDTCA
jgi:hypothetical protein